jgi:hypothetical protein
MQPNTLKKGVTKLEKNQEQQEKLSPKLQRPITFAFMNINLG